MFLSLPWTGIDLITSLCSLETVNCVVKAKTISQRQTDRASVSSRLKDIVWKRPRPTFKWGKVSGVVQAGWQCRISVDVYFISPGRFDGAHLPLLFPRIACKTCSRAVRGGGWKDVQYLGAPLSRIHAGANKLDSCDAPFPRKPFNGKMNLLERLRGDVHLRYIYRYPINFRANNGVMNFIRSNIFWIRSGE